MDEKIAKIDQSIKELESKKESVVAEYDAKITAARDRIKSLEGQEAGNSGSQAAPQTSEDEKAEDPGNR